MPSLRIILPIKAQNIFHFVSSRNWSGNRETGFSTYKEIALFYYYTFLKVYLERNKQTCITDFLLGCEIEVSTEKGKKLYFSVEVIPLM